MEVAVAVAVEATEVDHGAEDLTGEAVEMTGEVVVMMEAVIDTHQSKLCLSMQWMCTRVSYVCLRNYEKGNLSRSCIIQTCKVYFTCSRRRSPDYEPRGRRRSPSYDRGRFAL